jgi:AraC-like DNA-binding protein
MRLAPCEGYKEMLRRFPNGPMAKSKLSGEDVIVRETLYRRTKTHVAASDQQYMFWFAGFMNEFQHLYRDGIAVSVKGAPYTWFVCRETTDEYWIVRDEVFSGSALARSLLGVGLADPLLTIVGMPVDGANPTFEGDPGVYRLDGDNDVAYLLRQIAHIVLNRTREPGATAPASELSEMVISGAAKSLVSVVNENVNDLIEASRFDGVKKERFCSVIREIRRAFREPSLSAKDVSDKLGVSVRYVHTLLEETGVSFSERVNRMRLGLAYQMLTSPTEKRRIGQIAFDVGFNDQPYFNRVFKSRYGISPSVARAQCRLGGAPATEMQ